MITLEQALNLKYGDIVHENECTTFIGKKGATKLQSTVWKVNGKVQTWKTRPTEFKIPLSWGLYEYCYLTNYNCQYFHLPENCRPRNRTVNNVEKIRARG